jgi:hypothetical protein
MSILSVFKILSMSLSLLTGSHLPNQVFFESLESKTEKQEPIYNKISLIQEENRDIWKMKQSHHGPEAKEWDTIQIIVDKSSKPYKASYHQLNEKGEEIEYRTSCFRCHSGGPRYIRPKSKLSFKEKLQVQKWNWLIKSYGDVETIQAKETFVRQVPLKEKEQEHQYSLNSKACLSCHYKGGPRAPLSIAQRGTIKHLVKTGAMPPWPYKLTAKEKAEVKQFIYQF